MQYESKIWATADLLRWVWIKESLFPEFMMPFFALRMVESRLIREWEKTKSDWDLPTQMDYYLDDMKDKGLWYNEYILRNEKYLWDIVKNDKTFETDFDLYLKWFDAETQTLLWVNKWNDEEKYLDISWQIWELKKKWILFDFVQDWANINLVPFDNSEITTLEEHIKRKWADISAETAGEQYTPSDVISLIWEICVSKIPQSDDFITIYDPTCWWWNMLFWVEDKIKEKLNRPTATFGQDWNDALYALAKIESRFRDDSDIRYWNTLTTIPHWWKQFDIIVANPPYWVDWKWYEKDIKNDKTWRFVALPPISDGQLLFAQHNLAHLDTNWICCEVNNGSSLFSWDAWWWESEIRRKCFFENDWVEAIIQLPSDEFFNTNIITYIWVFNKNKPAKEENKVILINATEKFELLKKSRWKKRKYLTDEQQKEIVKMINDFKDTDYAKVYDREFFYYNKQNLTLTNLDEDWKTIETWLMDNYWKDKLVLKPNKVSLDGKDVIKLFTLTQKWDWYETLQAYQKALQEEYNSWDYKKQNLVVHCEWVNYYFDDDKSTIIEDRNWTKKELWCWVINIKASYKKATAKDDEKIVIEVSLTPDYENDYEIIPYSRDEEQNQRNIKEFLDKYVYRPYVLNDCIPGVEINFNKIFYKPEELDDLDDIMNDINTLDSELKSLEDNFSL